MNARREKIIRAVYAYLHRPDCGAYVRDYKVHKDYQPLLVDGDIPDTTFFEGDIVFEDFAAMIEAAIASI